MNTNIQRMIIGLCILFIILITIDTNREFKLIPGKVSVDDAAGLDDKTLGKIEFGSDKSVSDYDQITDRPLFMDKRQPYSGPETVADTNPSPGNNSGKRGARDRFLLSAVIITDSKKIALVQMEKNKEIQKLSEGDDVDGWIITDIQAYGVSLQKGTQSRQLTLMVKASPPQAVSLPGKIKPQPGRTDLSPASMGTPLTGDGPPQSTVNRPNRAKKPKN